MTKIQPENYRFLQEYIRRQSGIVLDDGKDYWAAARLLPVAEDYGMQSMDELCTRLRQLSDISLQRRVVEAMTTNETYFFSEPEHFDALRLQVIPALMLLRRTEQKLILWSAAVSTGQEAYSLAMLLSEMGLESWDIRIVGTDISAAAVERASAGVYSQVEIEHGLTTALRAKYCHRRPDRSWEIKPGLKRMTSFQRFDLRYNIRSLGQFDIVFCRNVLMYFDPITKRRTIQDIRSALRTGGHLFLGGSEVLPMDLGFKQVSFADATFFQSP